MALPVALQLYTVRNEFQKDMLGTLKAVKEMGYDGVEFAGLFGRSAAEIKAMLDEVGLIPVSAHIPFAEMMADPEGTFAAYKEIGCAYAAIPYVDEKNRPGSPSFGETLKNIERLRGYSENMIPVVSAQTKKLLGVITSTDITELVDEELGDDYAKLAAMTADQDPDEGLFVSMTKRVPWLIALLFLGLAVSAVVQGRL